MVPTGMLRIGIALPGLIDAHAHLFLDGAPVNLEIRKAYLQRPSDWQLARARSRWPKILSAGVMAVRDAGDKNGMGLALAADSSQVRGEVSDCPYIDSPGAAIHHQGRYGSFMARPVEQFATAEQCVSDRVANGSDRIMTDCKPTVDSDGL